MSAPNEPVEPEIVSDVGGGAPRGSVERQTDDLMHVVERVCRGHIISGGPAARGGLGARVVVHGVARPDHHGEGDIVVVLMPMAILITFAGVRLPLPRDANNLEATLAALVKGEHVVMHVAGGGSLRRLHSVRLAGGRFERLLDTSADRAPPPAQPMVVVFGEAPRPARADEVRALNHAMGGPLGRLKRNVLERIGSRALGAIAQAVDHMMVAASEHPAVPQQAGDKPQPPGDSAPQATREPQLLTDGSASPPSAKNWR